MHVNTDAEIINEIDMTDGFECFATSDDIKKKQQKTKKKKLKSTSKLICRIDGKSDSEISSTSFF